MENNVTKLPRADSPRPVVALVAHDRRKDEMVEWATYNRGTLSKCTIFATRTTGLTLQSALDTPIQLMLSGHDVDVKALLRLAVLYDVSIACNRSSADHIISSPLFTKPEKYRQDRGPSFVPWAK